MKKELLALVAACSLSAASVNISAVEHVSVDLNKIEAEVKGNPAHRSALLKKFNEGTSELSPAEMVTVYYGQAYTPGYKHTESYPDIDKAYTAKDWATTLALVDRLTATNPVPLNQLFRGFVASRQTAQSRAQSFENRIMSICNLIFASGTGVTYESPFYVLSMEDAQAFLRNYLTPQSIGETSKIGDRYAVKVKFAGQPDESILYFALL